MGNRRSGADNACAIFIGLKRGRQQKEFRGLSKKTILGYPRKSRPAANDRRRKHSLHRRDDGRALQALRECAAHRRPLDAYKESDCDDAGDSPLQGKKEAPTSVIHDPRHILMQQV
jgi:hypothetical protein